MALSLEPSVLTIFGITGDLAHRYLLPSLYHLASDGLLPKTLKIVAITRRDTTVEDLTTSIKACVEDNGETCDKTALDWLQSALVIVKMNITDGDDYAKLKETLDSIEDELGVSLHRLYYLAIPSSMFGPIVEHLGQYGLNTGSKDGSTESRLLIEKPFGYDLKSAEELIQTLSGTFDEQHIYRIDHYLAKEVAQNILTFRFENPLFSGSWDKDHVSHIMITSSESISIEGRVAFYEQMGALRDLVQSHLLQLLALVTMERPETMDSAGIHAAKEAAFAAMKPPKDNEMSNQTVRGQYATYREEVDNLDSMVETYAAVRLSVDNERWAGVPMFIRTGKSMTEKVTEITVVFNDPDTQSSSNSLTLRIQPHEGIVVDLKIKKPGFDNDTEHVQMDFCYHDSLDAKHPNAYERVLVDAMRGDRRLFATSKEVLSSWHVSEPILRAWQANRVPLDAYENGSWGPESADKLLQDIGSEWLTETLKICRVTLPTNTNTKQEEST